MTFQRTGFQRAVSFMTYGHFFGRFEHFFCFVSVYVYLTVLPVTLGTRSGIYLCNYLLKIIEKRKIEPNLFVPGLSPNLRVDFLAYTHYSVGLALCLIFHNMA